MIFLYAPSVSSIVFPHFSCLVVLEAIEEFIFVNRSFIISTSLSNLSRSSFSLLICLSSLSCFSLSYQRAHIVVEMENNPQRFSILNTHRIVLMDSLSS
jgi:hypothetical protein